VYVVINSHRRKSLSKLWYSILGKSRIEGPNDLHTPELLNTIVAFGLSNQKLTLKVGVPVMLLRNIDQSFGMCSELD